MPPREMQGPQQINADNTIQPGHSILIYQPFSTTDPLNWKNHTPPYSEKPQAMADLLESPFQTHQPTWDDCRQILLTLFNTEERRRTLTEARRWLQGQPPSGALNAESWALEAAPDTRPSWDFRTAEGLAALSRKP